MGCRQDSSGSPACTCLDKSNRCRASARSVSKIDFWAIFPLGCPQGGPSWSAGTQLSGLPQRLHVVGLPGHPNLAPGRWHCCRGLPQPGRGCPAGRGCHRLAQPHPAARAATASPGCRVGAAWAPKSSPPGTAAEACQAARLAKASQAARLPSWPRRAQLPPLCPASPGSHRLHAVSHRIPVASAPVPA